jgi:glucose-6-phosphate 1-epimerase
MHLASLNQRFGIPGVLRFEDYKGLTRLNVTSSSVAAIVYLQGAHLTHWQPAGHEPVLFLSKKSDFERGKAIRGGVPIAFPWFASDTNPNRFEGRPGPSHGFARIQEWAVAAATHAGEDVHITLKLDPTSMSRAMGFDHFEVTFALTLGKRLTMRLTVANESDDPLRFEEALHSYYAVSDVKSVTVTGLEPTPFVDKTQHSMMKPAAHEPLRLTGFTDRVYENTAASCSIRDAQAGRRITIDKTGSNTTVVFNPWRDLSDMSGDGWREMLAVETANAGANAIALAPRSTHVLEARVTVESLSTR